MSEAELAVVSSQLPESETRSVSEGQVIVKIPTTESHPCRPSRACNFKFRQWNGQWYGWCARLGCPNRIRPRPYKVRRVSAVCRGVYGVGDLVAFLLSLAGLSKQRWRILLVLLHLAEPGKGCSACDARQRWLNELLPRLGRRLGRRLRAFLLRG